MFTSSIIKAAMLLVAAAPALANYAHAPQPSHTSCTYSCPEKDNGHYSSHKPSCGNEGSGLVCSFPSKSLGPGAFNRDFTCTYDPSTGKLKEDRNSGYCPKTAEQKCNSYKRSEEELHVRAPSAGIPENMKARHVIKKRHLSRLD